MPYRGWGMPQTRLDIARRHVRDAEENITRQIAAVALLKARGEDIAAGQRLLRVHIAFLQVARRAVAFEEERRRHEETRN